MELSAVEGYTTRYFAMGGFLSWGRFTSLRPYEIESCVTRQSKIDEALERAGEAEAEMDEMWSFVGNKGNPRWLWHAIDHHTGKVLVPSAVITQRVALVAARRISRAVSFSCTSIESVLDDN